MVTESNIVVVFEVDGVEHTVYSDNSGKYNVSADDRIVQPNHDAEGIIRYMSHIIANLDHKVFKVKKALGCIESE